MTMVSRFASSSRDPAEHAAFRRRIDENNVVVTPHPAAAFRGELRLYAYGALHVAQATMAHGQSWEISPCDPEHVFVCLQAAGASSLAQAGKQVSLDAGALAMIRGAHPYTLALTEPTRLFLLKLPCPWIATRIGDPARLVAMCAQRRATALLSNLLQAITAQDAQHAQTDLAREPGWDDAVGDVLFDVLVLVYRQTPAALVSRAAGNERWQRAVRDFVERHLGDPELGASMIAHHLGVTPRYVQMAFAGMATTASAYIVRRRVDRAAQLLAERSSQVTDAALQAGFADLSHFYRSFRKRFGMSPRRYAKTR